MKPVKKNIFSTPLLMTLYGMLAGFLTYTSMYAFRKPFTAATFETMEWGGIDYKIVLILAQVAGYALSKFMGIKVVSEMNPARRAKSILVLIGISWGALLMLAITPPSWGVLWMFCNGLPLGMIWGLVFSFLEGRRQTEMFGAAMSVSFIVSSGLVKAVGKYLLETWNVSSFWMPFGVGLLFVPFLLLGVWMLTQLPPPSATDQALRTERVPMNGSDRRAFFSTFSVGIILVVSVYVILTIFRDIRDNFAVEIWAKLGFANNATVLATAEIPIGLAILAITGATVFIKNNRWAFYLNLCLLLVSGLLLLLTSYLFNLGWLPPAAWMMLFGFGTYLAYVSFHTMLFERWIALFKYKSNIGFLMYVADAFGYLGSVGILLFKNFAASSVDWLDFIHQIVYVTGGLMTLLSIAAVIYFKRKEKQFVKVSA
jgi:hypothetical protein